MSIIAFIPARSGSKRVINKNILNLGGHPLIYHTLKVAKKSKLFNKIFCITDSKKYQNIALKFGSNKFPLRPKKISTSKSPDSAWIKWALKICQNKKIKFDIFFILRPTSPFRTIEMLKKGLRIFYKTKCHSVRGVELTTVHPGKIWLKKEQFIKPLIKKKIKGIPWHSNQYAALPIYYAQNASLEICKKNNLDKFGQFSGTKIAPLITKGFEGFDINSKIDFEYARIIYKKINSL